MTITSATATISQEARDRAREYAKDVVRDTELARSGNRAALGSMLEILIRAYLNGWCDHERTRNAS